MQLYNEYSSDEDREGSDIGMWNPSELINKIVAASTLEEKQKLKRELLGRFLEQQRPILTQRIKELLLEEGSVELLISFVTRLDEAVISFDEKKPTVRPLNPSNKEEFVRKSFNVMEVFLNPMNDLDNLLRQKLPEIVRELFKIFKNNSCGNFHHFNKILEQLLIRTPTDTTHVLITENLLWGMLDFLHESPVQDTLIDIFCCGFPRQSDTIQFYKLLVDSKVFDKIGEKIYGLGQVNSLYVAEFFNKLLEKLSSFEMSGILFISLCRTSIFVDGLFKVATNTTDEYPLEQRQACSSVLRELLIKSGEKIFEQSEFARPMPNMLSAIHDKLHEHAKNHVADLCNALIFMDGQKKENIVPFSAFTIKRSFGLYKYNLTEVLTDLIICVPEVLDKVPQPMWRVFGAWFIEYCYNNLYHSLFYKVVQIIIRENHLESQKNLLNKYKFLSRMIEHYKSPEQTGARGFILLIANTLRLGADLQPSSGWLRHYLNSHDPWKQWLPQLRHDTQMQLKRYADITADMLDEEEGGFDEDLDIDLGSAYARSLGFEEELPEEEALPSTPKGKKKKKRSKKKKNLNSPQLDQKKESHHKNVEIPMTHVSLTKVEEEDNNSDPSLSQESWWAELKQEFSEDKKKKKETEGEETDWWANLKQELQELENK